VATMEIQQVTKQLAATPKAAARARASLAPLRPVLDEPTYSDLVLLVSELVTNSVHHANLQPGERIGLKVIVRSHVVQVGVIDPGAGIGATTPKLADAGGVGFHLVNEIAESWGTTRQHGLTRVWFELRRS
jgi:anti-sigma regulatory factor (Ser/Thr protein kinase)